MIIQSQAGGLPSARQTSGTPNNPGGIFGESLVSEICGRYSNLAVTAKVMSAYAIVTSGVIWSTAAGTGGPLLWNGTSNLSAHLLAVTIGGISTANTVATSIGITGNTGRSAAPGTTTAIDASGNTLIGGSAPQMNVYRIGTVTNAGNRFIPLAPYSTQAVTVPSGGVGLIDLGGSIIVPPGSWASVSFAATATTGVIQLGLLWAELPV